MLQRLHALDLHMNSVGCLVQQTWRHHQLLPQYMAGYPDYVAANLPNVTFPVPSQPVTTVPIVNVSSAMHLPSQLESPPVTNNHHPSDQVPLVSAGLPASKNGPQQDLQGTRPHPSSAVHLFKILQPLSCPPHTACTGDILRLPHFGGSMQQA